MSSTAILDVPCENAATRGEATYSMNEPTSTAPTRQNLVTPSEAARIMSELAGYEVTPDDIRQLRRRGKVKAARQTSRMTWYERSEIEKVTPPKKHHPKRLESASRVAILGEEGRREQAPSIPEERVLQIEAQKIELERWRVTLEERRLALEERRLALEERRLALKEKQLEAKLAKMGLAS